MHIIVLLILDLCLSVISAMVITSTFTACIMCFKLQKGERIHLISFVLIFSMIAFTAFDLEMQADKILGLVVLR